jgi:predicted metal-binding membrane protein
MEHWRGRDEQRQSFLLGVHHGLFCVGCCWSLMLLMFAVGSGNIAWMLLLGAVMAVEKNMPWGRQISKPLGAVLLVSSILVTFMGIQN